MYFHRANRIKSGQVESLQGIEKATEILRCTICNENLQLTTKSSFLSTTNDDEKTRHFLFNRPAIRKILPPIQSTLTNFKNREANRLLAEIAKDRQLLIKLSNDEQNSDGSNSFFPSSSSSFYGFDPNLQIFSV